MATPPPPERPRRTDRGGDAGPAEPPMREIKRVSSNPSTSATSAGQNRRPNGANGGAGARPAGRGNGPRPAAGATAKRAAGGPRPRPGDPAGERSARPRPDGTRPTARRPDDRGGDRRPGERRPADPSRPTRTIDSRPSRAPRDRPDGGPRDGRAPRERPPRAQDVPVYVEPPLGESSWTSFLRPNTSSKPGTMPAGMVLVVVVAALVVAMFLSADSINRKAASRRSNSEWRKTTADMVASVSKTLKLDVPERALDDAVAPYIGHERKTSADSSQDVLAKRRAAEAAAAAAAGGDPTTTVPGATTAPTTPAVTEPGAPPTTAPAPPTTVDPRPKLRTPTPDAPLKLWFGGDSIAYEPGVAFSNIAAESKLFTVVTESKPSTGLSRPDYFNWPEHLDRDIVPLAGGGVDPDIVMIMFGGNDGQNIPMPPPVGGYVLGSNEWQVEYRKRVADTMDLLRSPKNDRLVFWVGMPIVGPGTVKHIDQMDYIYWSEAQKRPWVVYFDSWAFFMTPDGAYNKSLPAADGEPHVMRANDNIHMSLLGGERLAWALHNKLGTLVDLAAAPVTGEPKQMPPPDVKERPEVPPGEGQAPAG